MLEESGRGWLRQERTFYLMVAGLALVGLALAAYLTHLYYSRAGSTLCEVGTSCDTVRESRYATLMKVPVALIGVVGYATIVAAILGPFSNRFKRRSLAAMATIGFAFSAYLTCLELFVIHALCPYCVGSAGTMTAIFLLVVGRWSIVPGIRWPRLRLWGSLLGRGRP